MSTLSELATKYTVLTAPEIEWLELLVADWPLLADFAFGDVVLWAPTENDGYLAIAHSRPAGSVTLFYRDVVGDYLRADWREVIEETQQTGKRAVSTTPAWYEENPMVLTAYAVNRTDPETGEVHGPIAVATIHTSHESNRSASRQIVAFRDAADDMFRMVQSGLFPAPGSDPGREQGAPRAIDGMVRLDDEGVVTFASPNAQSIFGTLGHRDELEGEDFSEVIGGLVLGQSDTNESLPLIAQGKVARRADVEVKGRTVTLRSIPLFDAGQRSGGIVLTRDVTHLRQQEQLLITKDATIREIHHRVKNNLQTVASLLRVQARRAQTEDATEALGQAMRRVAAIGLVHDTLSTGLSQIVDFDEVCERVLQLTAEVASLHNTVVKLTQEGKFGSLPSEYATPLSLALTEIVTNAVEHGLRGIEGEVKVIAERDDEKLTVVVSDDGTGLPGGTVGDGLGTQIVRTLIEGELGGSISWGENEGGGARVDIRIPLHWIAVA